MKVIGLTGGIGTGKSSVAQLLVHRGWVVLSSDETARSIMNTDAAVQQALIDLLGREALNDGKPNSAFIASKVFGPTPEHHQLLKALNAIVHPRVLDVHMETLRKLDAEQCPLVVVETALLFEVGLDEAMDYVIVVDAPDDVRMARIQARSGLSTQEIAARIAEQMPMTEKRNLADFVIDNSGTLAELETATSKLATIIEILPEKQDFE